MKNTDLVFIPGPEDFFYFLDSLNIYPFSENLISILKKKLPNVITATNPCRFSIFGKEFVFFRDNLNKNLSRNSIIKSTPGNNKDYFVHTIICQGNLSPLDLNSSAKIWHLAHSLNITPLPDFLILSDIVLDFVFNVNKTTILNPGSFTKDFTFYIVYPIKNIVEPCRVSI